MFRRIAFTALAICALVFGSAPAAQAGTFPFPGHHHNHPFCLTCVG